MNTEAIFQSQMTFFKLRKAGCIFAAYVAKNPKKYGWFQKIVKSNLCEIEDAISSSISSKSITTISLIFPEINAIEDLIELVYLLEKSNLIFFTVLNYNNYRCIGIRIKVNELTSWVSGFGSFEFLPKTRQAPYTEITFRVKPRPKFDFVLKASPENVIHLADLDLLGKSERSFKGMWQASFNNTFKILGHSPDLMSAAKTTFAIPEKFFNTNICNI